MLAAKKMNEMELNKVPGAGLDTINYILHHQNDKAQAKVVLPVPPWAIPHPTPHPGPVNPWPIPHPGPFPKPGPFIQRVLFSKQVIYQTTDITIRILL